MRFWVFQIFLSKHLCWERCLVQIGRELILDLSVGLFNPQESLQMALYLSLNT